MEVTNKNTMSTAGIIVTSCLWLYQLSQSTTTITGYIIVIVPPPREGLITVTNPYVPGGVIACGCNRNDTSEAYFVLKRILH
jgi:hypothetical protein